MVGAFDTFLYHTEAIMKDHVHVWKPILAFAATVVISGTAAGQVLEPRWNLQVRNADVGTDSCTQAAFRPEFKIINNSGAPQDITTVHVHSYMFNATPVEFVNSTTAAIFDFQGAFLAFANVVPDPDVTVPASCVPPNDARKTNQVRSLGFVAQPGFGPIVPPSGFVLLIPTYRRDGGASPFDFQCNDFSKVNNTNHEFRDDHFFSLFGADGKRICEFITPRITDPETGSDPCFPFSNGCVNPQPDPH